MNFDDRVSRLTGGAILSGWIPALVAPLLIAGCAAMNQDDRQDAAADDGDDVKMCSLDQVELRKALARDPQIAGVATPFLIHSVRRSTTDRFVRNGDVIEIVLAREEAASAPSTQWSLAALDPGGRPVSGNAQLMDGNLFRLHSTGRHSSSTGPQSADATADNAPPFMMIKADVPVQARPSTCDDQIRQGDFVFIHTISPSVWLRANPAGSLDVTPDLAAVDAGSRGATSNGNCPADRETCHQEGSATVCAWAPSCTP